MKAQASDTMALKLTIHRSLTSAAILRRQLILLTKPFPRRMVRQTEIPFYPVFCALRVFLSGLVFQMVLCLCYRQNNQVKNSHKGPESKTQEYTITQLSFVFMHVHVYTCKSPICGKGKSVTVGVTWKWETAAASYYSFFLGRNVFIFP